VRGARLALGYRFLRELERDRVADLRAVDRFAVERLAPPRFAVERLAVERFAVERLAPPRFAADRFAVDRLAPPRFAVERFAVERFADDRFAVDFFAPDLFALDFFDPDFFAPAFFAEAFREDERDEPEREDELRELERDEDRVAAGIARATSVPSSLVASPISEPPHASSAASAISGDSLHEPAVDVSSDVSPVPLQSSWVINDLLSRIARARFPTTFLSNVQRGQTKSFARCWKGKHTRGSRAKPHTRPA
jgi:hypothetical protein